MHGQLLVLPDAYRKYLSRSERAFHRDNSGRAGYEPPAAGSGRRRLRHPTCGCRTSEDMQRISCNSDCVSGDQPGERSFFRIGDKYTWPLTGTATCWSRPCCWHPVSVVREFYEDLRLLLEVKVLDVDVMGRRCHMYL
jgi:hypothetical protein